MNTVKMLALREWMQHGRAWLLLAGVPLAIALVAVSIGHVEWDAMNGGPSVTAQTIFYLVGGGYMAGMCAFAAAVALMQAPGLARRDVQDRSIEFWLSLPIDHGRAVLVPMALLLVGMPLLIMLVSLLAAPLLGGILALRIVGGGETLQTGWGSYAGAWLALGLRQAVGIVLGALWLAPLVALVMAASAWFKRWGAVIFVAVVFLGAELLSKLYAIHGPQQALFHLLSQALNAYTMIGGEDRMPRPEALAVGHLGYTAVRQALLADMGHLLAGAATLPFVGGLVVAALGVWAQVLRRVRG